MHEYWIYNTQFSNIIFSFFSKNLRWTKFNLYSIKVQQKVRKKIEIDEKRNLKMATKRIKIGCSIYRIFVKLSIREIIQVTVEISFSLSNCFQKNEKTSNNCILNTTIWLEISQKTVE